MPPRTVIGLPSESSPLARFIRPSGRIITMASGSISRSTWLHVSSRSRVIEITRLATSL